MVQQPRDSLRGAQRGGSAAEVAGAHRLAAQVFPPGVQFAVHGLQKRVHAAQVDAFVEIAVGADALAEGYVEIKSGHINKDTKKADGCKTELRPVRENLPMHKSVVTTPKIRKRRMVYSGCQIDSTENTSRSQTLIRLPRKRNPRSLPASGRRSME